MARSRNSTTELSIARSPGVVRGRIHAHVFGVAEGGKLYSLARVRARRSAPTRVLHDSHRMRMRAIVITRPGGPEVLEMQERPTPEPGLGQVRVRVRASALNRADLSQRLGAYPAPPGSPADIPGME